MRRKHIYAEMFYSGYREKFPPCPHRKRPHRRPVRICAIRKPRSKTEARSRPILPKPKRSSRKYPRGGHFRRPIDSANVGRNSHRARVHGQRLRAPLLHRSSAWPLPDRSREAIRQRNGDAAERTRPLRRPDGDIEIHPGDKITKDLRRRTPERKRYGCFLYKAVSNVGTPHAGIPVAMLMIYNLEHQRDPLAGTKNSSNFSGFRVLN